MAENRF